MGAVASPAPRNDQLGYEAALDLGVAALEHGLTAAAVPYLERAVSCRATRFALVQLAKAHRDLGQLEAARSRLEQARVLPDGEDLFVLVTLAAVLSDLREHGSAFEVAMEAVRLKPDDPAALAVVARSMRELTSTLAKQDHIDQGAIDIAQAQAEEMALKAKGAQPESVIDLKERRRVRATQAWSASPPALPPSAPVEQAPASVLEQSLDKLEQPEAVPVPIAEVENHRLSPWQRAWRRLVQSWQGSGSA
jgi:tetratricopeptide (TPR) repeat protein